MKRVTSKNAFAEFAFAEKDGRDALCGWLLDVVNGPKPKPLVISGPAGSGTSTLLMLVAEEAKKSASSLSIFMTSVLSFLLRKKKPAHRRRFVHKPFEVNCLL